MSEVRDLEELKTQALTCVEAAYDKGYKAAKQDIVAAGNKSEYERGLNDAEKAVRRLTVSIAAGGLTPGEKQMIFGLSQDYVILTNFSMSEIIEKIREYDERKRQEVKKTCDDEIHIGDEICLNSGTRKYIVTAFLDNGKLFVLEDDGFTVLFDCNEIHKTGRNYPIMEILRKLNESEE